MQFQEPFLGLLCLQIVKNNLWQTKILLKSLKQYNIHGWINDGVAINCELVFVGFIHEFGHFIAAKMFKMRVDKFLSSLMLGVQNFGAKK
ncbi:MAG: site-2 protease family protein [Chitinophagales bacterium]|nr:site-2 protease family protein [Chitinophagales bacterium]